VAKLKRSQFRFRRHESIGAEGAEQDGDYLDDCYYDIGDLGVLRDAANPQCLIVGRTGAGKSALLQKLADAEAHVSPLAPMTCRSNTCRICRCSATSKTWESI
jgi:hypothetical protein